MERGRVTNNLNYDGQADDEKFRQLSEAIVATYDADVEKMKAIHDGVAAYFTYDFDSLKEGRRKKEDALSALENRVAVCGGYTNLITALLLAA